MDSSDVKCSFLTDIPSYSVLFPVPLMDIPFLDRLLELPIYIFSKLVDHKSKLDFELA